MPFHHLQRPASSVKHLAVVDSIRFATIDSDVHHHAHTVVFYFANACQLPGPRLSFGGGNLLRRFPLRCPYLLCIVRYFRQIVFSYPNSGTLAVPLSSVRVYHIIDFLSFLSNYSFMFFGHWIPKMLASNAVVPFSGSTKHFTVRCSFEWLPVFFGLRFALTSYNLSISWREICYLLNSIMRFGFAFSFYS